MATASIRINQAANASPTGVAGRSRDDLLEDQVVQLRNADDTGVRAWRWTIVDRPYGSTAALSSPVAAAPTFTPDVVGSYLISLVVNTGRVGEVDRRVAAVRDALGLRVPAAGETNEANWLIDGSPNARGYQPEFETIVEQVNANAAMAADITALEADVAALESDVGDLDTALTTLAGRVTTAEGDITALEATTADHETRIDTLETTVGAIGDTVDDLAPVIVYDLDFTAQATNTLSDGAEVIDGLSWTAANIAARTTLAEITNGQGLRMTHVTGSTSQLASADTAPRISIALSNLIPSYNPLRRYFFLVQYSWAVTPDAAGERFSLGIVGAAASPWPSTALRFAGATASYNATALAPTHEGERTNTILNGQAPEQVVLGFSLDGPKTFTIWQATSMPTATLSGLVPVAFQLAANATAGGDYDIFHYAAGRFTLALAATGSAAIHSVIVTRLRVIRG